MKIGQVAKNYNISKDNLYYYINYGLLVPPKINKQYVFDDETLEDLSFVLHLKDMEYSLQEIHEIISLKRISNLQNPEDKKELQTIYADKRNEFAEKINHYEKLISELDRKIIDLSRDISYEKTPSGVPVSMLDLICCGHCADPMEISDVKMDMKYIYEAKFKCKCGYEAEIKNGILITPNRNTSKYDTPDVNRELYKDLPPSLISLFQRSYNWMKDALSDIDTGGKVVMETYVNAWFFLHNHQQYFSPRGKYIVVDKYPETLEMYKDLIDREKYGLNILYIADSSMDLPIRKESVDLHLDFFAVNEHNFYKSTFLFNELEPYMAKTSKLLGTYFYFDKGHKSIRTLLSSYPEASPNNFSLDYFQNSVGASKFQITDSKDCGFTTDSGNNLGFSFHSKGEPMHLMSYICEGKIV